MILKNRAFLLWIAAVGMALLVVGCGGGDETRGGGTFAIQYIEAPEQIGVGGVALLSATVTGANNAQIEWSMENPNWTATSASGENVTWTAPGNIGTYTVTVMASAPGKKDVIKQVTINVVDELVVNIDSLPQPIVVGQQVMLQANVSGHESENASVTWKATKGTLSGGAGTGISWEAPTSATDDVVITVTATTPTYPQGVTNTVIFDVDVCSGGDMNNSNDPCEIGSYPQFRAIQDNRNGHYRLIADIDLSEGPANFRSFWTFDGTLSGGPVENPHTIRNLSLRHTGVGGNLASGLFNAIGEDGAIYNVILENVTADYTGVTGAINGIGALAGVNSGTIQGVTVRNADIATSGGRTGGLVGTNEGTIKRSAVIESDIEGKGTADTTESVGGLVGYNEQGATVETSFALDTNVKGKQGVGGLVGTTNGTVTQSYSLGLTSKVTATDTQAGGLIGYFGQPAVIELSYSAIPVVSPGTKGGLTGHGYLPANVTDSFWDKDVAGTEESRGGTGRSSGQMKGSAWYPQTWKSGSTSWNLENDEYPDLKDNSRQP